jgi:hypothetical protein
LFFEGVRIGMKFFKVTFNRDCKQPATLAPWLWQPGDVVSIDDLAGHDIERLLKNGDLRPYEAEEAKYRAEWTETWLNSLHLRRNDVDADLVLMKEVECHLQTQKAVVKALAG